jgi:hypothetical protein
VRAAYVEQLLARSQARGGWLTTLHEVVAEHGNRERVAPVRGANRPAWLGGTR